MTGYINLEDYVKEVIVGCIVDLYLAAGPSNAEFLPCEIEEGFLKIYYKENDVPEGVEVYGYKCKYFNIQEIIEEYLKR